MLELQGKHNHAKVFTDNIEETAVGQVIGMLNEVITKDVQVRVMPDVHAGKGSTVGTTFMYDGNIDKVSPNIVGRDVGCGIYMMNLGSAPINLERLNRVASQVVPTGFSVLSRQTQENTKLVSELAEKLTFSKDISSKKMIHFINSLGTLGGGNHYLELAEDENGDKWLSVHSGSRNLGGQVAELHQTIAEQKMYSDVKNKDLAYLADEDLANYLNDMNIAQQYAHYNRKTMLTNILNALDLKQIDEFDSIHNFIDLENKILRKGATSAQLGERLVIPLNMRDGSLICVGKGNADWNYSAPHGAGRVLSRSKAKKLLSLDEYQEQMKNVYTTSVTSKTIDEAPLAYKPAQEIIDNITDTVDIIHHLKPLWNMKAH